MAAVSNKAIDLIIGTKARFEVFMLQST
jgi:hypothetical protein